MISLVFASLLFAQQAAPMFETANTENTRTYTVSYPYAIAPYVDDYNNCLKSREIILGEGRTFEGEYKSAIPQCTKVEARALQEAVETLTRRNSKDMTPKDAATLFETLRAIHVDRGRVLDGQMAMGLGGDPYSEVVTEDGPVVKVPNENSLVESELVENVSEPARD